MLEAQIGSSIRVMIVDDHQVLVDGLRALLDGYEGLTVVGTAASAAEAIEAASALYPDVILMDRVMPGGSGVSATMAIRERMPDVAIVFLSGDDADSALYSAVEAGAVGYLLKANGVGHIADAVRRAAAGEMLLPPGVLGRLIQQQRRHELDQRRRDELIEHLTPRELEVLGLMAAGLDNQEIAERLHISYLTVRGHVRAVLAKLGSHTKLAAVARASELGLV